MFLKLKNCWMTSRMKIKAMGDRHGQGAMGNGNE
jgi:hypothetical protein